MNLNKSSISDPCKGFLINELTDECYPFNNVYQLNDYRIQIREKGLEGYEACFITIIDEDGLNWAAFELDKTGHFKKSLPKELCLLTSQMAKLF